jgi:histidine ammonia-lyase
MSHNSFVLGTPGKKISDYKLIAEHKAEIVFYDEAKNRVQRCYDYLSNRIAEKQEALYGINTGFGSLCNVVINSKDLTQLQENLIRSHACGVGENVSDEIVRIMLIQKANSLSIGNSGVKVETIQRLLDFYKFDILPVVPSKGSLGASGDLAPLAHLCLPLIGEGFVKYKNEIKPTLEVLKEVGLSPIILDAKEGLALLNGTQFMTAYGTYSFLSIEKLQNLSTLVAAASIDGYDARKEPFHPLIHYARLHKGQMKIAEDILALLEDSEIFNQLKVHVQDPYSFRCIPQVHGAAWVALQHAQEVLTNELNAVTDNPNIFPDDDLILSGGNFHGESLALAFDYAAIAVSELGSISERRTYNLISGQRGLPPFLAKNPGLNSGLMIPQYTAAALLNENKVYCYPASADSITSSNGQEDHVSMGATSARKLLNIVDNTLKIYAIEWLTATQALGCKDKKTSKVLETYIQNYREEVPFIEEDRFLHADIERTISWLSRLEL